tara:strand:+ start:340 stop:969 length:630 start_codon:yes stop_codon:yes gene_type:complete
MKRFKLFPSLVYVVDCSELIDDVKKACDEVDWDNDSRVNPDGSNISSIKHALQVGNYSHLIEKFEKKLNDTISELNYDNRMELTTSWFTKTPPNKMITTHYHTNSLWSGVFYYEDSDHITLSKGPNQIFARSRVQEPELMMCGDIHFPAMKGKMIIFPSNLLHHVKANKTEKIRYSLAMNFMPVGISGCGDSIYYYSNDKFLNENEPTN